MSGLGVAEAVERVIAASPEGRADLFKGMDQPMKKAVRKALKEREKTPETAPPLAPKPKEQSTGGDSDEDLADFDWTKLGGGAPLKKPVSVKVSVTEKELDEIWASIEADDTSEYDLDLATAFDYQGFNAQAVVSQIVSRGKRAGLGQKAILKDISLMCALAHKKGSINDKNYPKMKKSGQSEYDRLAGIYQLVKGGAKGATPETVTISRIGPTFSAKILRLILDGKLAAKTFIGPFKSSSLHSVMQTQYFVSVLPSTLPERSKEFITALCRAYSSDQTIALTQGKKPSAEEVWERQQSFVELTRSSDHPSDEARKSMSAKIPWADIYDKTNSCIAAIKRVDNGFAAPSRADFLSDLAKI